MELLSESNKLLIVLVSGFAIVAIAANQIAFFFQKIKLPLITGLLVIGILAGPYVLQLIPLDSSHKLNFINDLALAFIAFAAGAELYLRELRSRINSIKWITVGQLVVTMVISSISVFLAQDYISFMKDLPFEVKLSISLLMGTIFVARSPASAIAIINELRAKGPFTQTVMGVTVLKDFLVIILFAICFSVAKTLVKGDNFDIISILLILLGLGVGAFIGYALGKFLELTLSFRIHQYSKTAFIILSGYLIYILAHYVEHKSIELTGYGLLLEPLLICIIASMFVTNYTKYRPEFHKILTETGPYVFVAFFTLTGASLSIGLLFKILPIALLLFVIRLVSVIIGSYFGGIVAREPMHFNHVGWMPYVTQAGVALGLATIVANEFTSWGHEFATVVVAVIVINQFVGPPLFKWAIYKIGENHDKGSFEFDGIRDAIIFGYESQSVALARQLLSKGWEVKLATLLKEGEFEEPEGIDIRYITKLDVDELNKLDAGKSEAIVSLLSGKDSYQLSETCYHHFGTPDIIVRLDDRYYYDKFLKLGVNIVDPSMAIVNLLDHFVRSPQATSLLLGMETGQDSRDLEVLDPNLHGITLRNLRLPADVIILSIKRGGQIIISHGYTRLRIGDIVTFVGSNESLDELTLRFDK